MTAPDPARRAAYDVLRAVRVADAYTNLALPVALGRRGVTGRDAAFATELASGTIRRRGTYDAVLGACCDRPLAKVQVKVLDILRLGCHQLLSMRVPPHAAISTSVDLAHSEVGDGAAGFPTAVLDSLAAVTWVASHGDELGADPSRIAVMGDSAGGNLAAVVCQVFRDRGGPAIAHQSLIYPATDLRTPEDFDAAAPARTDWPILSSAIMVTFRDQYLGPDGDADSPMAPRSWPRT